MSYYGANNCSMVTLVMSCEPHPVLVAATSKLSPCMSAGCRVGSTPQSLIRRSTFYVIGGISDVTARFILPPFARPGWPNTTFRFPDSNILVISFCISVSGLPLTPEILTLKVQGVCCWLCPCWWVSVEGFCGSRLD
jgi:hypothetical protein